MTSDLCDFLIDDSPSPTVSSVSPSVEETQLSLPQETAELWIGHQVRSINDHELPQKSENTTNTPACHGYFFLGVAAIAATLGLLFLRKDYSSL